MAIEKAELMQECFPKHFLMGPARMKYDQETDEDGKKKGVSVESKAGTTKKSIDGLSIPKKGKIFYGQEPPSGESTTTECGVNCQLLAVMY